MAARRQLALASAPRLLKRENAIQRSPCTTPIRIKATTKNTNGVVTNLISCPPAQALQAAGQTLSDSRIRVCHPRLKMVWKLVSNRTAYNYPFWNFVVRQFGGFDR